MSTSGDGPEAWLVERSIAGLQELMGSGERSAVDITSAYLERIEALDGPYRSVVETNPDAVAIASSLDQERAAGSVRGPLHGIPILLKENIDTGDSMLTTAGSLALMDSTTAGDAFVVSQLRAAGAVILGKLGMSEWAFFRSEHGSSGWSGRNGQVGNAFDPIRTPGGSSSGSGVAASLNLAAATIGTETDGSIVSPANANGVVGLKPTVGLTSRHGVIPISASQDTIGPLARTVADAAAVLTAMAGTDAADPATGGAPQVDYSAHLDADGLRSARLGIMRTSFPGSPKTKIEFERAVELMRRAGAEIVEVDGLPSPADVGQHELPVLLHEFKAGLEEYLATRSEGSPRTLAQIIDFNRRHADTELIHFGQDVLEAAELTTGLDAPAYLDALQQGQSLARSGIDDALDRLGLDALIAPTGGPAPMIDLVHGERRVGGSSTLAAVAGYPIVSVPSGVIAGLPVNVSFIGTAWSESTLIKLASGFEAARGPRAVPQRGR